MTRSARSDIRRARAICALYFRAYMTALATYYCTDIESNEHQRYLDIEARYDDACSVLTRCMSYLVRAEVRTDARRKTFDEWIRENAHTEDLARNAWLRTVADDVRERMTDPSIRSGVSGVPVPDGVRKMPRAA